MKKSELTQLINALHKQLPISTGVPFDYCAELYTFHELLKQTDRYGAKCTDKTQYVLMWSRSKGGKGGRYKCIHLRTPNSGALIPLTKTKLLNVLSDSKPRKLSDRAAVLLSMRSIISGQIDDFRANHKSKVKQYTESGNLAAAREMSCCPITGKIMFKTHVDHYPKPFIQLADEWAELNGFDKFKDVPYSMRRGGHPELDSPYKESWEEYHAKYAGLRLVGAKANMRESARGYKTKK